MTPDLAEVVIQLSGHIDELARAMPDLAADGRYWWYRPADNTFHASNEFSAPVEGGRYLLLDASVEWLAQWAGDWGAAADSLLEALVEAMDQEIS